MTTKGLAPQKIGDCWYFPRSAFRGAYTGTCLFVLHRGRLYTNKDAVQNGSVAMPRISTPGTVWVREGEGDTLVVMLMRDVRREEVWRLTTA